MIFIKSPSFFSQFKQTLEGPAITIHIVEPITFSIDLVPIIEFGHDRWIAARGYEKGWINNWNAVPKPWDRSDRGIDSRKWICSYVKIEREIINGINNFKNLIRIFKVR